MVIIENGTGWRQGYDVTLREIDCFFFEKKLAIRNDVDRGRELQYITL